MGAYVYWRLVTKGHTTVRHHRARRVLTLHAPLGKAIAQDLLVEIEKLLIEHGATSVWISHEALPDLQIMASVPDTSEEGDVSARRRGR